MTKEQIIAWLELVEKQSFSETLANMVERGDEFVTEEKDGWLDVDPDTSHENAMWDDGFHKGIEYVVMNLKRELGKSNE